MKVNWFHLMPYRFLPANIENDHHNVGVDIPTGLFDPLRGHSLYNEFLDEIEFATKWDSMASASMSITLTLTAGCRRPT
jgi:hypothetical protein